MKEDLHNIDKLFKNGIEDHLEEVPPAVWDAVSRDLDKKQASYYKDKYYRLKRAALLLLLLGFLGGSYILVQVLTHKEVKTSLSKPIVTSTEDGSKNVNITSTDVKTTPDSNFNLNTSIDTKQKDSANQVYANETNGQQEIREGKEKPVTIVDTTSGTEKSITKNQNEKQKEEFKNKIVSEQRLHPKSSVIINNNEERNKKTLLIEQSILRKNDKETSDKLRSSSKQPVIEPAPFRANLLIGTDRTKSAIDLLPLFPQQKTILPEKKIASATKIKTTHSFSLTAFASPNFSFDRLEDDKQLSGPGRNRRDADKEEQENISFSGGLLLNYQLSKKILLQSGVAITSSVTSIAPKTIYAKADNNGHARYELHCSSGYSYISPKGITQPAVGDSAQTSGTKSRLAYISVPVAASFIINKGKLSFYPTVGAGINILTSGKTETQLTNTSGGETAINNISGLKSTYIDGRIGIGAEYSLNKNLSISIRPTARIALTPINQETPVRSYQNYMNVETGIRIKL